MSIDAVVDKLSLAETELLIERAREAMSKGRLDEAEAFLQQAREKLKTVG